MNPDDIINLRNQMIKTESELGTLASKILDKELYSKQSVVKVVTNKSFKTSFFPEAKYFVRKVNDSIKNVYHHLGIYCYKSKTLGKFISLLQSTNEI